MARKKKATKHSFTPEIKAEAMRLIFEEHYTSKQAAESIGCSVNAIQKWKVAAKSGKVKKAKAAAEEAETTEPTVKSARKAKKTRKTRKGKRGRVAKKTVAVSSAAHQPAVTFDEFAHDYWKECAEAMEVMQLPPSLMPKAIEHINNVLRYAYDQFYGQ